MEMLHGSDGWEKLVSELQQKEEDDAQHAAAQGEQQPTSGCGKRARPLKDSSDPLLQHDRSGSTLPLVLSEFPQSLLEDVTGA